jgi:hypothetical protein
LEQLVLRLILLERPGVGRSTPCPDRTLTEWVQDVERCADRLGLERFMVAESRDYQVILTRKFHPVACKKSNNFQFLVAILGILAKYKV